MRQKEPCWRFREMQPGELNVDPIEGEFFNTEAIGSIADALVRESIQNSLDAANAGGQVTVRFSFKDRPNGSTHEAAQIYLQTLFPHLHSNHSGLQNPPSDGEELSYMLIEDFGTCGLQGDVLQHDDLEDAQSLDGRKNDFYYFWRNIGRTQKGDTDLGRWGLGKTVFAAASRINSFFGLTLRGDDRRCLLMGRSVLKIHRESGRRYAPYGYFGLFEGELALPVEESVFLKTFCRHFSVQRRDESGLTVLIPYPDRDLSAKGCIQSVLNHYFFPLLSGKLIVEVTDGTATEHLDARSLPDVLRRADRSQRLEFQGLINLTRWALKQPEQAFIRLKQPDPERAPKLREELFDPETIQTARSRFLAGKRLALHIPVSLQRKGEKEPLPTGFDVFIERDETLQRAEDRFIRRGITIPEITSLKHKSVRAIVSITDHTLSAFLGDAENPAHTEWERNSKRLKRKYTLGRSTLDFIKSSPREIVRILTQPAVGRDENLLRNIFALPSPPVPDSEQESRPEDVPQEDGSESSSSTEGVELEVSGNRKLQLRGIRSGFSVSLTPGAESLPKEIEVMMAYEVRSGNPFKKYTPLDFDVERTPIQVRVDGAELLLAEKNVLRLRVENTAFQLQVTGFDSHRDLRVKTIP